MTDKTTREKIAEHLIAYSYWLTSHYESVGQNVLEADRRADAILTISEIQEGQELREKAKSGVLVELHEDQTLPDCHWLQPGEHVGDAEKMRINCPCSHRGFRRVKVKGE